MSGTNAAPFAVTEITRWTCGRCGAVEEQNKRDWQPNDWATLRESTPPKSAVDTSDALITLCRPCRTDLRDWLTTPPEVVE